MLLKKGKLIRYALLLALAIYSCTDSDQKEKAFSAALPQADTPFSSNIVDGKEGGVLSFPNGTTIEIPENAFVDKNGNPVTSKVEIAYREFHDAGSILASGIPMEYNYNGQQGNFVTAGMFEIRGYVKGNAQMQLLGADNSRQEVYIAEGKAITSKMASFANDTEREDYNFYFFNEETGQWEPRGGSEALPNQKKLDALEVEAPMPDEPLKPEPFDRNTPVVDLAVNTDQFPELKAFKGILWQYAGEGEEQNPHSPQNIKKLATIEWDNIELQPTLKKGVYMATFSSSKEGQKFVTELKPVLRGKNYEKELAKFNKKLEKFQAAHEKRIKAEEKRAMEGNFIREATINKFGVYNHDWLWTAQDLVVCNARFQTEEGELTDEPVYMLTENNKGLVRYDSKDWDNVQYLPRDAVFVAILGQNKIGVISRDEVASLGVPMNGEQTFSLTVQEGVNSPQALSASIANLW